MRVETILQEFVGQKLANNGFRVTKINAITDMLTALLNKSYLTLSSLGAHLDGPANVKHKIKRIDRWLNNDGLFNNLKDGYSAIFNHFILSRKNLDILVDWTGCCNWTECCIRASVVCSGRSVTIYQEIHANKMQGKAEVQKNFLNNLRSIIPPSCSVTIITDRGFQTKWFETIREMGWDFIGRAHPTYCYQLNDSQEWFSIKSLYNSVKSVPKHIGKGILSQRSKVPAYFHAFKAPSMNRKYKKIKNKQSYPEMVKMYRDQNVTPWILITSHSPDARSSKKIISDYHSRMQIEQTFRDDKSMRFGYGFRFGRTQSVKRLSILLFLAAICSFILMIIGAAAEEKKLQQKFQANTVKKRRVLSLLTLAKGVLRHCINSISRSELIHGIAILAREPQTCVI